MKKRIAISIGVGAVLGVVCIIGGSARAGGVAGNELYLIAMWYNRVIIGLVVGLAGERQVTRGSLNRYVRGALLGMAVSAAFFVSTGMRDIITFIAGILYGMIIEYVAQRYA